MAWWLWFVAGVALLGVELFTPGGFFVFFFGIAAIVVGALVGIGLIEADWIEWLAFSLLSIVFLLLFRAPLVARMRMGEGSAVGSERLVGEIATLVEDLEPGGVGKAELRGASWSVRSAAPGPLPRGRRCRVERVEGLTLWVTPEA